MPLVFEHSVKEAYESEKQDIFCRDHDWKMPSVARAGAVLVAKVSSLGPVALSSPFFQLCELLKK